MNKIKLLMAFLFMIPIMGMSSLRPDQNLTFNTASVPNQNLTFNTASIPIENPLYMSGQQFNKGDEVSCEVYLPLSEKRNISLTVSNLTDDIHFTLQLGAASEKMFVQFDIKSLGVYNINVYADQENITNEVKIVQTVAQISENHYILEAPGEFINL